MCIQALAARTKYKDVRRELSLNAKKVYIYIYIYIYIYTYKDVRGELSLNAKKVDAMEANTSVYIYMQMTDTRLGWAASLPKSIGTLPRLKKIMLAQNRLRKLPAEIGQCQDLELIRLSNGAE